MCEALGSISSITSGGAKMPRNFRNTSLSSTSRLIQKTRMRLSSSWSVRNLISNTAGNGLSHQSPFPMSSLFLETPSCCVAQIGLVIFRLSLPNEEITAVLHYSCLLFVCLNHFLLGYKTSPFQKIPRRHIEKGIYRNTNATKYVIEVSEC